MAHDLLPTRHRPARGIEPGRGHGIAAEAMDQPNPAPLAGLIAMSRSGELRLANRLLAEGTALHVWLAGAWQLGRVARAGAGWTIRLLDRSAVPAVGAIARLPDG